MSDWAGVGGLATHVTMLAEQLIGRGHEVVINVGCNHGPRIAAHVASGAGIVTDVPLARLMVEQRFDVVNVTDEDLGFLPVRALVGSRSPVVATLHSRRRRVRPSGLDAIVSVYGGQAVPTARLRRGPPVHVVPNPVDLDRFTLDGPTDDLGSAPVLAWIGRPPDRNKDVGLFLGAALELGPSWRPLMVTETTYVAAAQRLRETVPWLEVCTRPWADMPAFLRGVAQTGGCLIITSRSEGDPLVVGEALGCGTPVVAPMLPAIVPWEGLGAVIAFDRSGGALAAAKAVTASTSPAFRSAEATADRRKAAELRDPSRWGLAFEEVYASLVARRPLRDGPPLGPERRGNLPSAPSPDLRSQLLGVAVTSYRRPDHLARCLASVAELGADVAAVCVVDSSPHPSVCARPDGLHPATTFEVIADGSNSGLPAALGRAFDVLRGCDPILVLDDDTCMTPELLAELRFALSEGVGVAAIPTWFCGRLNTSLEPQVFAWSPTLLRRAAVDAVAPPDVRLFFGHDDYEMAVRLRTAGWRIAWVTVPVPERSEGAFWPERHYFALRNATWLATRRQHPVFRRLLWLELSRAATRQAVDEVRQMPSRTVMRSVRAVVTGLAHGLVGRLGPPPRWVLDGRT